MRSVALAVVGLWALILTGCSGEKIQQADGSSTPRPTVFGNISESERLLSLPTVQRRRVVAMAVIQQYELSNLKSVSRVQLTPFKPAVFGSGETACAKVEYSDPIKHASGTDTLALVVGTAQHSVRFTDMTRALFLGPCGGNDYTELQEFAEVKKALAEKRDPITLALRP